MKDQEKNVVIKREEMSALIGGKVASRSKFEKEFSSMWNINGRPE